MTEPEMTPDWQTRALAHAAALRALLIVRDPGPGTAGRMWLDECEETFKLAGVAPGFSARTDLGVRS